MLKGNLIVVQVESKSQGSFLQRRGRDPLNLSEIPPETKCLGGNRSPKFQCWMTKNQLRELYLQTDKYSEEPSPMFSYQAYLEASQKQASDKKKQIFEYIDLSSS